MGGALPLRILPAFAGAVLVTLAVFLFMQGLIEMGQSEEIQLAVYENVEILRPEPEREEPERNQESTQEQPKEPTMEALTMQPAAPAPTQSLELPALDLSVGDVAIQGVGDSWNAPMGGGAAAFGSGGQDARGFVEVVPYNTRRPNVPDVAWHNKISGWVLVAFTVTPQGQTRDVRVLDARPRGVFEEKVIAAVEDWQYTLNFKSKNRANLVLTQRVEVRWQDYPQNLPNVD